MSNIIFAPDYNKSSTGSIASSVVDDTFFYQPGFYYINHPFLGTTGNSSSALAPNSITYTPIRITKKIPIDRLSINVSTGLAGSNVRLSLYRDKNGLPDAVIAQSGNLDCSTVGQKDLNFTPSQQIEPSWYWAAIMLNGAGNISITAGTTNFGFNAVFGNPFVLGTATVTAVRKTGITFGAFPTLATQDNPITYIYNQMPLVWYRVAAA